MPASIALPRALAVALDEALSEALSEASRGGARGGARSPRDPVRAGRGDSERGAGPAGRAAVADGAARTTPADAETASSRTGSTTPGGTTTGTAARAQRLSRRYLADHPADAPIIADAPDAAAYLTTRMPATYAAARFALGELAAAVPSLEPVSLLDVGAGTGAATWAAWDTWPSLERAELRDYSAPALAAAERLLRASGLAVETHLGDAARPTPTHAAPAPERRPDESATPGPATPTSTASEPTAPRPAPPAPALDVDVDVALTAYVLSELTEAQRAAVVATLTARARDAVVIVEPGTPAGYRRILAVRDALLAAGWTLAGPCPHALACPVASREGDWCHAAVRLPRTREHRVAKGGELSYEDEKLAWVAAVRDPARHPVRHDARVLRHPATHPGHVRLELCTPSGERVERTVSKRDKAAFRAARKVEWGETWGETPAAVQPDGEQPTTAALTSTGQGVVGTTAAVQPDDAQPATAHPATAPTASSQVPPA